MRAIKIVLFAFLLSLGFASAHADPVYPVHGPDAGLVNDFANVLSVQQSADLEKELRAYETSTKAEIVVVTVPSLQGQPIEEYANGLFRNWGIGKKGADNGVLLLISTGDKKVRIEVGYRLEAFLTDAASSKIIHEVIGPEYHSGQQAQAIIDGTHAIMTELSPGLTAEGKDIMSHATPKHHGNAWRIVLLVVIFFIVVYILLVVYSVVATPRYTGPTGYTPRRRDDDDTTTGIVAGSLLGSDSGGGSNDDDSNDGFDLGGGSSGGGGASGDL